MGSVGVVVVVVVVAVGATVVVSSSAAGVAAAGVLLCVGATLLSAVFSFGAALYFVEEALFCWGVCRKRERGACCGRVLFWG